MIMGGSNSDYRSQVTTALQQANQPKSALAQNFSGSMQGMYLPAISNMLNAGMMNAFPGMQSGMGTTGSAFNQNQPQNPISNGPPTPTPTPIQGNKPTFPYSAIQSSGQAPSMSMNSQASMNGMQSPSFPGYNGGFTPQYNNIGGVDVSQYAGQGLRFSDLINKGVITQDQLNQTLGAGQGFNPANQQANYQQYLNSIGPNGAPGSQPDYNTWANSIGGLNAGMLDQYAPNDPSGFQNAMSQFPSYNQQIANQPGMQDQGISQQQYSQLQSQFPQMYGGQSPQGQNPSYQQGSGVSGIPSMGQQFGFPQIQQANPHMANMNLQGMNPGAMQTLQQQYGGQGVNGYNPSASMMQGGSGINGLANTLQSQIGGLGTGYAQGNLNTNNAQQANTNFSNSLNPQDSQYYQGIQNLLNQQLTAGRDDIRARFGASGGNSRGTAASYAEGQYNAAALPQLASALGQVRQSEVGNQLQAANLGLQGQLGNAQNQLTAQNQGNNALLQNQGLANNFQGQNLGTLGSLFSNQQGIGAQLANQAGNLNLGQQQLGSQNYFQGAGLNSQNAMGLLQNQLGFQTNQNQAQLGQNNINSQLGQFNSGQQNQYTQQYMQMLQQANQQQIQNYMNGYQNIFGTTAGLAGAGIPGGSANVNLGAQSQSWLGQLGGIL